MWTFFLLTSYVTITVMVLLGIVTPTVGTCLVFVPGAIAYLCGP